ncbi:MAG: response regulator [Thermoproteota archaeon]|nr:response regulator [Thermoproteota archaeon]
MPKRDGDSFSKEVIVRILQILLENGKLRKSHLAGKTRTNYQMCVKYLSFLDRLQWIEIIRDSNNFEFVSITSEGTDNLIKLKNEQKNTVMSHSILPAPEAKSKSISYSVATADSESTRHKLHKKKIIIIDDDEDILATYKAFLNNGNFRIRTFSDSAKAFEFLALHPRSYDVIVLDIRMPKMSGLKLYQAIKLSNSTAKVIFLSSLDAIPELTEMFPELGKSQLLRKPVSRKELIEAILAIVT